MFFRRLVSGLELDPSGHHLSDVKSIDLFLMVSLVAVRLAFSEMMDKFIEFYILNEVQTNDPS